MKILTVAVLVASAALPAQSNENKSVQDLMVLSKFTGVCGVMQQMGLFQTTTKMTGGAEFIERFWKTEFARLGKSQAQFFKECEESIALYTQLWEASEPEKRKR
jgi:hypothetical protein